jgi:hypothetical protein
MSAEAILPVLIGLNFLEKVQSDREQASSLRLQSSIAHSQAERERAFAAQQASEYQKQQAALIARRRSRLGASGVALAGSPLLADDAAIQDAALGEARIRAGGEERAGRLEADAALARSRAPSPALSFLRYGQTLLRDTQSYWGKL